MLAPKIRALFKPENYHGWGRSKRYFEGWYYKIISADEKHAMAFIPGIAMDEKGQQQAFIQILNAQELSAVYHKFPSESFKAHPKRFELKLADNFFNAHSFKLHLPDAEGQLHFKQSVPWPSSWYSPGIMGPFSFIPFMECYHGILSMDHRIEGELTIKGKPYNFDGGRGYMEKDWGHSFPSAYIWMQSNHFSEPGISLKASVARIPWLGNSFVGFIAGIWLGNRLIQFTTYNLSRLKHCFVDAEKVELVMDNLRYRLEIVAHRAEATELAAPIAGFMDGRISESMSSKLEVRVTDKRQKKVIFEDIGRNAGLEAAGRISDIQTT